jgi:alanine racemase
MNRLGFSAESISELSETVRSAEELSIKSVYSHFTSSEDPADSAFTKLQIKRFDKMFDRLEPVFTSRPLKHMANTSGILNYPEAHYDMVRLGIGFYGFDNTGGKISDLRNVVHFKTRISQIHHLKKGESVSYNRRFITEGDREIAVIPVGYADGFKRSYGNGNNAVYINGQRAPVAGTVCMDSAMIDITGLDCKEGDEVTLFGHQDHIRELAKNSNTITYEIITSVSQRVRRCLI